MTTPPILTAPSLPEPLPTARVFLARPSYGPSPDREIDTALVAAVMFAANHGVSWAGPLFHDREQIREARNSTSAEALELAATFAAQGQPIDGVVWVDDDVVTPINAFWRLATYNLDLVSGLYFQRSAPYLPVAGDFSKKTKSKIDFWWDYPPDVVAPAGGFGFGCCFTSIAVLKAVSELEESREAGGPFSGLHSGISYGEDFLFCARARSAGFQPLVDTGIRCRHHLDSRYSDEYLYTRFRGELLPPAEPGAEIPGLKVVVDGESHQDLERTPRR